MILKKRTFKTKRRNFQNENRHFLSHLLKKPLYSVPNSFVDFIVLLFSEMSSFLPMLNDQQSPMNRTENYNVGSNIEIKEVTAFLLKMNLLTIIEHDEILNVSVDGFIYKHSVITVWIVHKGLCIFNLGRNTQLYDCGYK